MILSESTDSARTVITIESPLDRLLGFVAKAEGEIRQGPGFPFSPHFPCWKWERNCRAVRKELDRVVEILSLAEIEEDNTRYRELLRRAWGVYMDMPSLYEDSL